MVWSLRCAAVLVLVCFSTLLALVCFNTSQASAQGGKSSVKVEKSSPPAELNPAIGKLLKGEALQVLDGQGALICEVWLRQVLPADATPEQVKNGLTFREVKETTILGAVKFAKDWTDNRKQRVRAGVYTLRLGYQPMDGDHAGTSPHQDFVVLVAAGKDTRADTMDTKAMIDLSMKSIETGHPAVFMLWPNAKPAPMPQLVNKSNHWILNVSQEATAAGMKATIGISLTLTGHFE
jgi:hypothetical protein